MKKFKLVLTVAALLSAMLFPEFAQAGVRVYVRVAPPAPKTVVVKSRPHRPGAVWVAGYWKWNGKRHVWIEGRYIDPWPGYVWMPGHWVHSKRGWYWVDGHWKKV